MPPVSEVVNDDASRLSPFSIPAEALVGVLLVKLIVDGELQMVKDGVH